MTTENAGNGFYMPVAPAYGGGGYGGYGGFGGFGGDWGWIVLLLLCAGGGWGGFGGGFGGFGNMMLGYDFPWLMNGQQGINNNVSSGFRDAQLSDGITSIRDGISGISTQICNTQMADMERSYAAQTATAQGFTTVNQYLAGIDASIAREACATRTASMQDTQKILDKLCQLELDGVKQNYENRIAGMQNIIDGLSAKVNAADRRVAMGEEVDALYNRLNSCPVPSTPVFGRTPIFTCNSNNGCGCNNGVFYN